MLLEVFMFLKGRMFPGVLMFLEGVFVQGRFRPSRFGSGALRLPRGT